MTSTIGWSRSQSANGSTSARTSRYDPEQEQRYADAAQEDAAELVGQELEGDEADELADRVARVERRCQLAQEVGERPARG